MSNDTLQTSLRQGEGEAEARSYFARTRRGWLVFGIGAVPTIILAYVLGDSMGQSFYDIGAVQTGQLVSALIGATVSFIGAFIVALLLRRFPDVAVAIIGLILLFFIMVPGIGIGVTIVLCAFAGLLGIFAALRSAKAPYKKPTTFGSAEWATQADLVEAGLTTRQGYSLGAYRAPSGDLQDLHYGGDRHLLTVAPTRAGKGVSAIIPNLLTYDGSILCIDPKGENALITGKHRAKSGHDVKLVDPWNLASGRMEMEPARFNPLDWLTADDPDLPENAMLLADALVVPSGGNDRFWDEEAKGLIFGLLLYLATDAREARTKTLGRMRDLLVLSPGPSEDPDEFTMAELMLRMQMSEHALVRAAANRYAQKEERERASVMSSAQAQTHFLDSPRIRESLSASDFDFADLKTRKLSIFLILPADRLNTFGRWLRLLIQQAITVNARNIDRKPDRPVLFMLDEMPALGHLASVEQAYGLMAGFGMQLWGIVQDLSQLKRIYGDGWETFIGNSGVLQYFGSRDSMTAEYFSKLCGVTTVMTLSETIGRAISSATGGGGSTSDNHSFSAANAQRNLAYPDELMTLPGYRQLLLVENRNPIAAEKVPWFKRDDLKNKGMNLARGAGQSGTQFGVKRGWGAIN